MSNSELLPAEMPKLKSCPFCGGPAFGPTFSAEMGDKDAYEVECPNCCFGIEGPAKRTTEAAKEAAITAWNTRARTDHDLK